MSHMKTQLMAAAEVLDVDPVDLFLMIDTEKIRYEIHADDSHSRGTITVPRYLTGDPKMAVALYFFGERTAVGFVTKAEVL